MMIQASKRHGRVRRDSFEEPYWRERFMIARRVTQSIDADELPDRRDRGRAAVRIIERIAGELFRRPRNE